MKKLLLPVFVACSLMSAQATVFHYHAIMSGPAESPPNASPGRGVAYVSFDDVAHTISINAVFSGLLANTTAAHIHAPTAAPFGATAGVAIVPPSFPGFPIGVTSGTFVNTFNTLSSSTYNSTFMANNGGTPASAEAALHSYIQQGRAYFNIHSSMFTGGEIRGFLVVPEPTSLALFGMAAAAAAIWRRKARA